MTRILIADDQIPEGKLKSENEVRDYYMALHKDSPLATEFAEGCVFFHRLIIQLRDRAYEVDCANTPEAARDFVRCKTYDAIILDLGWWALKDQPERMSLGWQIAKQLRESSSAPILMFSNRFLANDELAKTAAENHLLPIYKSYDEACAKYLLLMIRWATHRAALAEQLRGEQQRLLGEKQRIALRMYSQLSKVLLISIALGGFLVIVTLIYVLQNNSAVTLASTVFGLVSSFISAVIYNYVRKYEESINAYSMGGDPSAKH
jgi:CheY-like chemotaxis protein